MAINYCSLLIYSVVVNVFFDPDTYNVTEGETAVITLRADSNFTVPFDVNVTLRDGSAVGEYWFTWPVQYGVCTHVFCRNRSAKVPNCAELVLINSMSC